MCRVKNYGTHSIAVAEFGRFDDILLRLLMLRAELRRLKISRSASGLVEWKVEDTSVAPER